MIPSVSSFPRALRGSLRISEVWDRQEHLARPRTSEWTRISDIAGTRLLRERCDGGETCLHISNLRGRIGRIERIEGTWKALCRVRRGYTDIPSLAGLSCRGSCDIWELAGRVSPFLRMLVVLAWT